MPSARLVRHSYADYLDALEHCELELEYCEGEIYAMPGGTPTHADLGAAAIRILGNALLGRCRVSSSDLKVRVEATDLSTFPDLSVVCGSRETSPIDRNAITNPTLLVEVTSHSTEHYDRGDKLSHYKQIPSLQAVLIVSHRRRQVSVIERGAKGWTIREIRGGEQVEVASVELAFALDELYAGIELQSH